MASGTKSPSSAAECIICHETFKEPKLLDCAHSFCKDCLQQYRDTRFKGHPKLPCPMCKQETVIPANGIQGLKTNFQLTTLVAEITEQDQKATMSSSDASRCQKHTGEVARFYCETCHKLICRDCTVLDHCKPVHQILHTDDASIKYKKLLRDYFPLCNQDIQGLKVALQDTSEAKKVFIVNTEKALQAVKDRAAEVITQIKAEEKRLLDEITVQGQDHNKRRNEHEKTLREMLQRKKHSLETAEDVTKTASDTDFLARYQVISKDMEKLSSQHPPKVAGMQSYPVFMKSQKVDINLGKVVKEDTWKLCLWFGKQGSGPRDFEGARGIAAAKPGEIAVADGKNGRVVIYDNHGQIKNSIPVAANDVAAIANQWVLANLGIVKVYSKDNTLATEFRTVPQSEVGKTDVQLYSVAVRKTGNIIVGDVKRNVLTEHSSTDQSLIHTIPVEIRPDYLAVMNNDRIVISDWEQGRADIVDVVDGKAVTASTIKPTIGGKPVKHCSGVSSSSSGIYIGVDTDTFNTGHIHQYDDSGHFVSCVAQGLYYPLGTTFTADGQQLAVADVYSVKMYHKV